MVRIQCYRDHCWQAVRATGPRTYGFFLFLEDFDIAVKHVLLLVQLLALVVFPVQVLVALLPWYDAQTFATCRHSSCGCRSRSCSGPRQRIAANLRRVLLHRPAADDCTCQTCTTRAEPSLRAGTIPAWSFTHGDGKCKIVFVESIITTVPRQCSP